MVRDKLISVVALLAFQAAAGLEGNRKIVGGEPAEPGRYPWIVGLIEDQSSSAIFCGGTLIAENVVLSAAHCGTPFVVDVGCHTLGEECERAGVLSTIIDPSYDGDSNDFSIIQLNNPIVSVPPIRYLAGPNIGNIPADTTVTVIGWGVTIEGGGGSDVLLEVEIPIVDQQVCKDSYEAEGALVDDSMICAGEEGKDSCQGDSGGPLFLKCDNNLNDVLIGVVSWGNGCAQAGFPGVYAKISSTDFITTALAELDITLRDPPPFSDVCSGTAVPVNAPSPVPAPVPINVPTLPGNWDCPIEYYASGHDCDCDCGGHDPDCENPDADIFGCSSVANCVEGVCQDPPADPTNAPVPTVAPDVPDEWSCAPFTYSQNDGCDCACGAPDPDCDDPIQILYNCESEPYCVNGECSEQPASAQPPSAEQIDREVDPSSGLFSAAVALMFMIIVLVITLVGLLVKYRT